MTAGSDAVPPRLSRMGLGLAAVGRPAYITTGRDDDLPADRSVSALRSRAFELLDSAHAHGIRYVEGQVTASRPVCVFPLVARYDGRGDPSDASSYRCARTY